MRRFLAAVLSAGWLAVSLAPYALSATDANSPAANPPPPIFLDVNAPPAANPPPSKVLLKGNVSQSVSPLIPGKSNVVPAGTTCSMTMIANVNSEVSQVGDDVVAMVSLDCKNKGTVLLPGQWCVHGKVAELQHQRRLGRDGYVTVHFDKLVSPDGKFEVPIDVNASTHESEVKAVAKVVAKDSVYVSKGAVIGAVTSVRITGIPLAVATHGYSVAAGAALGATVGLVCALKRKGKIVCGIPGEELAFRFDKPVTLPAFNAAALPSALPVPKLENLNIVVEKHAFLPDPFEDRSSRLLRVSFKMVNNSDNKYSFSHLVVISDHNKMYFPYMLSPDSTSQRRKSVSPNSQQEATLTFGVDSPRRKYYLVLLDRLDKEELTRVPVN